MTLLSGQCILVTGATGVLGTDLCIRLEELGAEVVPLALPGYSIRPKRTAWRGRALPIAAATPADLCNLPTPDRVINLHWQTQRHLPFGEQLGFELAANLTGLGFLWEWLKLQRRLQTFTNISTLRVFSQRNSNPISANTEARPSSPYGIMKQTAEHFFDTHFSGTTTKVTHLLLGSVASVGEHPSQLMSRLYAGCFRDSRMCVNDGHSANIMYIDDAVDLVVEACVHAERSRYLLAPPALPIREIALEFERIAGRPLAADYIDLSPGVVDPEFVSDIELLQADWLRTTSLTAMIRRFIAVRATEGVTCRSGRSWTAPGRLRD